MEAIVEVTAEVTVDNVLPIAVLFFLFLIPAIPSMRAWKDTVPCLLTLSPLLLQGSGAVRRVHALLA